MDCQKAVRSPEQQGLHCKLFFIWVKRIGRRSAISLLAHFRLGDSLFNWFRSYLNCRLQNVKVNPDTSTWKITPASLCTSRVRVRTASFSYKYSWSAIACSSSLRLQSVWRWNCTLFGCTFSRMHLTASVTLDRAWKTGDSLLTCKKQQLRSPPEDG